jgi:hypothetical protein
MDGWGPSRDSWRPVVTHRDCHYEREPDAKCKKLQQDK